jgi:hypothetical protein
MARACPAAEGWIALSVFVVAIVGWHLFAAWRFPNGLIDIAGILVLVAALIVVARAKTAGAWRWRWGE